MKKNKLNMDFTCGGIHKLWHSFCNYMKQDYYRLETKWILRNKKMMQSKRKYKEIDFNKIIGYKAICKLDRFIKNNNNIINIGCDDNVHANSDLYLIPHENEKEYWGTTVLYIPQCTTDKNVFFLYPNHLDNLIKELKKLQKRQKSKQK